jgi:hypothetical protein
MTSSSSWSRSASCSLSCGDVPTANPFAVRRVRPSKKTPEVALAEAEAAGVAEGDEAEAGEVEDEAVAESRWWMSRRRSRKRT